MKARRASEIKLSSKDRETLERYVRRRKTCRSLAQRAEIILRAAAGDNCEIARAVQETRQTVRLWRERFSKRRLYVGTGMKRCPKTSTPLPVKGGATTRKHHPGS